MQRSNFHNLSACIATGQGTWPLMGVDQGGWPVIAKILFKKPFIFLLYSQLSVAKEIDYTYLKNHYGKSVIILTYIILLKPS